MCTLHNITALSLGHHSVIAQRVGSRIRMTLKASSFLLKCQQANSSALGPTASITAVNPAVSIWEEIRYFDRTLLDPCDNFPFVDTSHSIYSCRDLFARIEMFS